MPGWSATKTNCWHDINQISWERIGFCWCLWSVYSRVGVRINWEVDQVWSACSWSSPHLCPLIKPFSLSTKNLHLILARRNEAASWFHSSAIPKAERSNLGLFVGSLPRASNLCFLEQLLWTFVDFMFGRNECGNHASRGFQLKVKDTGSRLFWEFKEWLAQTAPKDEAYSN